MPKCIISFCFFVMLCLGLYGSASASIQYLPRYQGGYQVSQNNIPGRDVVKSDCQSHGGMEAIENQVCSGSFKVGNKTCYKECHCDEVIFPYTETNKADNNCSSVLGISCLDSKGIHYSYCEEIVDTSEVYTKVISAGPCYMETNYSGKELWGKDVIYELYCHDNGEVIYWGNCFRHHVAWYQWTINASRCDETPQHQIGYYQATGWNCTEEYKREWCE